MVSVQVTGQIEPATDGPKPLNPIESVDSFQLPSGFRMELVASEPLIEEPSGVCWDAEGHLYVSELHGYNLEGQFDIKTLFVQEMLSRGFLTFGSHNLSYSHGDDEIASLLSSYEEVLPLIKTAIDNSSLNEMLNCEKLKPLFKVR